MGTDRCHLSDGFAARGHSVTLFATTNSRSKVRLAGVATAGYEEDSAVEPKVNGALHIAAAMERAADFDVMLNQFDFVPVTFSRLIPTPLVTTIHGFGWPEIVDVYRRYNESRIMWPSATESAPDLRYAATIRHGIGLDSFRFQPEPGKNLLFLGRIHPEKEFIGRSP